MATFATSLATAVITAVLGPVLIILLNRNHRQGAEIHVLVNSQMKDALAEIVSLKSEIAGLRQLVTALDDPSTTIPPGITLPSGAE